MANVIIQIIGWIGTALVVAAYFLISQKKLSSESRAYQLMNLFGALFISVNVGYQKAWPALGLQVVWGMIAIFELIKMGFRKPPEA